MILDPGFNLTLRPMKYPQFYQHYLNAIIAPFANTVAPIAVTLLTLCFMLSGSSFLN